MNITLKDLLGKNEFKDLPKEHQDNLMLLLEKVNKLIQKYGKSAAVTSGYRSMNDHLRIYKDKGITDQSKIPMKSKHLSGQAVDLYDPGRKLQEWSKTNILVLEELELWMEDFSATPNWCHFQTVPPKSKNRFFKP